MQFIVQIAKNKFKKKKSFEDFPKDIPGRFLEEIYRNIEKKIQGKFYRTVPKLIYGIMSQKL